MAYEQGGELCALYYQHPTSLEASLRILLIQAVDNFKSIRSSWFTLYSTQLKAQG